MYPVLRMATAMRHAARRGPMAINETDSFTFRVWPVDLDVFMELNNGRVLTLFDLGRFALSRRTGLIAGLRRRRWGLAVAGSFIRYRRRITLWQKIEMRTRLLGIDGRFILLEQAMWRGETCCSHLLVRTAVTGPDGVVPPSEVVAEIGADPASVPEVPAWAHAMVEAEGGRPWPPAF